MYILNNPSLAGTVYEEALEQMRLLNAPPSFIGATQQAGNGMHMYFLCYLYMV